MGGGRKEAVILFDGVCNFCNGAVQFILKRDRRGYFRFASLQSSAAKGLLAECPELLTMDSIVLIEDGKFYVESTAVFRIAGNLDGLWKSASIFLFIPKGFRDRLYRYFSQNRYRWFGRQQTCMIPSAEMKNRFLSDD